MDMVCVTKMAFATALETSLGLPAVIVCLITTALFATYVRGKGAIIEDLTHFFL